MYTLKCVNSQNIQNGRTFWKLIQFSWKKFVKSGVAGILGILGAFGFQEKECVLEFWFLIQ